MDRNSQSINSRILSIFFHNPNNFISTMLVGNNIALVIYGILMAQVIEQNLLAGLIDNHFLLVLIQTIISTLIILVTRAGYVPADTLGIFSPFDIPRENFMAYKIENSFPDISGTIKYPKEFGIE